MDLPFYREYELPWTTGKGQEKKFQRLLGIVFLVTFALGIIWPFLPAPEPDIDDVIEIPPRIAQLLLEEKPLPPPPPPEPEPEEPEPEDEPEPEPEQVAEEPEPEPEPIPEPEPEPDREEVAREQAQAAFMPFAEDLGALVDQDLLDQVNGAPPTMMKQLPVLPMARAPKAQPPLEMSPFKFAKLVEHVLEEKVRPQLAKDGGDLEVVDIKDQVVYVAMTGVPVESIDALISLKADLYRFELGLLEEGGEWRVIRSRWKRVDPRVL